MTLLVTTLAWRRPAETRHSDVKERRARLLADLQGVLGGVGAGVGRGASAGACSRGAYFRALVDRQTLVGAGGAR